jgi:hypothetical protein
MSLIALGSLFLSQETTEQKRVTSSLASTGRVYLTLMSIYSLNRVGSFLTQDVSCIRQLIFLASVEIFRDRAPTAQAQLMLETYKKQPAPDRSAAAKPHHYLGIYHED